MYKDTKTAVETRAGVIATAWRNRRASWLQPLVQRGLARCFEVVAQTRVVLWLASPSATELGFCLHHVYGLPYLPPSGLKGLASKALWRAKDPTATWQDPPRDVLDLFGEGGDHGHEGRVAFLDGIPLGDERGQIHLEVDVMTPHHAGYYAGLGDPHDCEGPNPLPFLCIPSKQRFEIGLVYTREPETGARGPDHWLSEAEKWLLKGLAGMGIGAKTTSGYGIFKRRDGGPPLSTVSGANPPPTEVRSDTPGATTPSSEAGTVIGTVISTDRNTTVGQARLEDGRMVTFSCVGLSHLGIYRQNWRKTHGQRFVFERRGDQFVPIRKEESS